MISYSSFFQVLGSTSIVSQTSLLTTSLLVISALQDTAILSSQRSYPSLKHAIPQEIMAEGPSAITIHPELASDNYYVKPES